MNDKLHTVIALTAAILLGAFLGSVACLTGCASKCEPCKIAPDCCKPVPATKGCKCSAFCRCETCDCKPGAKCDRDCNCGPKGCKCDKACGCEKCDCVDGKRCAVNCNCQYKAAAKKPGALELAK